MEYTVSNPILYLNCPKYVLSPRKDGVLNLYNNSFDRSLPFQLQGRFWADAGVPQVARDSVPAIAIPLANAILIGLGT
jgi:hypothetical protein